MKTAGAIFLGLGILLGTVIAGLILLAGLMLQAMP